MNDHLIHFFYIIAATLFIFGIKMLGHPLRARKGNIISATGMLLAVIVTLLNHDILSYKWILAGISVGTLVGVLASRLVAMTSMPEMVALLNGLGGLTSLLVAWEVFLRQGREDLLQSGSMAFSILVGAITFSGSLLAWGKLKEIIKGRPLVFCGQRFINICLMAVSIACAVLFMISDSPFTWFYTLLGLSFVMGILFVLPIGGADMPVVISLLNSYSGLAACAAGLVIQNQLLIVAGSLVGASGIILTSIMCKAMNRSLRNVLFSGFGSTATTGKASEGKVNPIAQEDCFYLLEAATSVLIVPGYGLAVAQAQHTVRELQELLQENGCEVRFAIHPVAGRMPGHMNVLLAEANIPYDFLVEMDDANPTMETVDLALVIGANDVVNPAAKEDSSSPIYGMPIIEVNRARTVVVLKRSMNTGFAGIENPLFFKDNTRMLFGDAKSSIQGLVGEFKN